MATDREIIAASLAPMFAEARAKGLWFFCTYADVWFAPDELEAAQAEGRFMWGATNWRLRDPGERMQEIKSRITALTREGFEFAARVEFSQRGGAA